jgi:DNA-binding response OmpR family regulator
MNVRPALPSHRTHRPRRRRRRAGVPKGFHRGLEPEPDPTVLHPTTGGPNHTGKAHDAHTIAYDREARSVYIGGRRVQLTRGEGRLVQTLLAKPGRLVSHAELLEAIWPGAGGVQTRTHEVQLSRLRRKLRAAGVDPIENVRGDGWRWVNPPSQHRRPGQRETLGLPSFSRLIVLVH